MASVVPPSMPARNIGRVKARVDERAMIVLSRSKKAAVDMR